MRKRRHPLRNAVIVLMAAAAAFLLYRTFYPALKEKAAGHIIKSQLAEHVTALTGLSDAEVEDIINVIPEEQQEEIIHIAAEHITPSTIKSVSEMVQDRDYDDLADFVQNEFTLQEKEQVQEIVTASQDAVIEKLREYGISADSLSGLIPSLEE